MAFGPANETLVVNIVLRSDADVVIKKVNRQVQNLATQTKTSLSSAQRAFRGLSTSARFFGRTISTLSSPLRSFNRRWTALGVTIGTTLATFKAVGDAQKFGIAVAEISTIFDDTELPLAKVEERLLSLSETLGLVETVAAKGFYQIISSDITDAAEAMIVLENSAKLATAGLASIKGTVDVVTSVIKAYQKDISETEEITDILFRTVEKGKTTIPELSTSLGQVLPIAASLGVEFRQVTAAIATLTQGGIETNTAVIQLRQAFNQLLKPSAEASEVLAQYNIDISQAAIRNKQFSGVLTELKEKLGNNAVAYAKIFGNIRALLPVLALADKQFEQFQNNLDAVDDSSGAVERALDRLFESPFKRIQVFINAIRIKLRGVGEVFIEGLDKALGGRAGIQRAIKALDTAFNVLKGVASEAAEAIGDVVSEVEKLIKRLDKAGNAGDAFRKLGEVIGSAASLLFKAVTGLLLTLSELAAQLPDLLSAIAREFQQSINEALPGWSPFDLEPTKAELRDGIAELESEFEYLVENIAERTSYLTESELRRIAGAARYGASAVQSELDRMIQGGVFVKDSGEKRRTARRSSQQFVDSLVRIEAQLASFEAQLDSAPEGIDTLSERLRSALEPMAMLGEEAVDLTKTWNDFREAMDRPFDPDKTVYDLLEDMPPFAFMGLDDTDPLDLMIAERLKEEREGIDEEAARIADEFLAIKKLLEDLDLNVPFPKFHFDPQGALADQDLINELRSLLEDEFQITVPLTVGEENLLKFIENAKTSLETLNSLRAVSADTLREELVILESGARLRRAQLGVTLRQIGASEELVKTTMDAFEAAELAQAQAAIGFENTAQFFSKLAGKAEMPFTIVAAGVEESTRRLKEMLDEAIKLGLVAEGLRGSFMEAIDANAAQQLNDALDFTSIADEVERFGKAGTLALTDQVTLAKALGAEERKRLEDMALNADLTAAQRDVLLEMSRLVEGIKIDEALDFTSINDELESILANVEPTFREIVTQEEERNAVILARARALDAEGRLLDGQLEQLEDAVGFARERLIIDEARSQLNSGAFERTSFLDKAFDKIDFSARGTAMENLGLDDLREASEQELADLKAEHNRVLDEMLASGEAFTAGFGAALDDMAREFGDTFERGARLAQAAVMSVRDAVQAGLQELILFKEEGEDTSEHIQRVFRETLATGLASAVTNSVSDALTGGVLGLLGFGGEDQEDPETEAAKAFAVGLKDISTSATAAITKVAESSTTAITSIEGTFAAEIPRLATALEPAAVQLEAAANAIIGSVGGAPALEGADQAAQGAAAGVAGAGAAGAAVGGEVAAEALTGAADDLTLSAFEGVKSSQILGQISGVTLGGAAEALILAAVALEGAAGALIASTAAPGATGGLFPSMGAVESPTIPFGDGGVMRPVEKLGLGGVKVKRTFAEIAERGQNEAVVPLPGAGRSIPVEFMNPQAMGGGGESYVVNIQVSPQFSFQNLDPRSTQAVIAEQMPGINRMLTANLETGRDSRLSRAVRKVARRGS